ncbi:hypothetical protein ACE6H2_021378 [Prunus campanulata]
MQDFPTTLEEPPRHESCILTNHLIIENSQYPAKSGISQETISLLLTDGYRHSVKDDMLIVVEVHEVDRGSTTQNLEVKDAITKLLQDELGLKVLATGPKVGLDTTIEPGNTTDLEDMSGSRVDLFHAKTRGFRKANQGITATLAAEKKCS